jgi:hypothetical protein
VSKRADRDRQKAYQSACDTANASVSRWEPGGAKYKTAPREDRALDWIINLIAEI